MLEWRNDPHHLIYQADLMLVETGVNDVAELKTTGEDRNGMEGDPIAQETEMLIRLLMLLPKNPYLIWVGASSSTTKPAYAIESHLKLTVPS
jgi:hypothetical protein